MRFRTYLLLFLAIISIFPLIIYWGISWHSSSRQFKEINDLPNGRVGLVLGTSKYLRSGKLNPYYQTRIESALKLYQAGKIHYFIVSGDNRSIYYNEPAMMRNDLIAGGIPPENIQPDYAGLRTLDSVLRAKAIFGQNDYIVISQPFHNARALFLARWHGHEALAFDAPNPPSWRYRVKTEIREIGARLVAVWDLITHKKARHYGEPIQFPPR